MLDDADRIWNRACDPFAELAGSGDRALQAALLVHGQVMNGGLLSALESIDYDRIERGASGFEYFGLNDAADVLRAALLAAFPDGPIAEDQRFEHLPDLPEPVLDHFEGKLDAAFDVESQALDEAFARVWRDRPHEFAPVSPLRLTSESGFAPSTSGARKPIPSRRREPSRSAFVSRDPFSAGAATRPVGLPSHVIQVAYCGRPAGR